MSEKRTELILRWNVNHDGTKLLPLADGSLVLYHDHRAALEAVEAEVHAVRMTEDGMYGKWVAAVERAEQAEKQLAVSRESGNRLQEAVMELEKQLEAVEQELSELKEALEEAIAWMEAPDRIVDECKAVLATQPSLSTPEGKNSTTTASGAPGCERCSGGFVYTVESTAEPLAIPCPDCKGTGETNVNVHPVNGTTLDSDPCDCTGEKEEGR